MANAILDKMIKTFIIKPAEFYMKSPAKFLTYSLGFLYGAGTVGQVIALTTDKKIPAKEKGFLIPQELINGTLELVTYLLIATRCEKLFKAVATKGSVIIKGMEPANPTFIKSMEVLGSLIGAVVTLNFITPILRNPITSFVQKHFFKGNKISEDKMHLTVPPLPASSIANHSQIKSNSPFAHFENVMKTGMLPQRAYAKPSFASNALKVF